LELVHSKLELGHSKVLGLVLGHSMVPVLVLVCSTVLVLACSTVLVLHSKLELVHSRLELVRSSYSSSCRTNQHWQRWIVLGKAPRPLKTG
jgi:hypothetical protein